MEQLPLSALSPQYQDFLLTLPLFRDVDTAGLARLLDGLAPSLRRHDRGEVLVLAGYESHDLFLLLEGEIEADKLTPGGGRLVISRMGPGGVFGDVLCGSSSRSPVTVTAKTACLTLQFPCQKFLTPFSSPCSAHSAVLRNLLESISDKYFSLSRRVDLLILKSLRAKLCRWLLDRAEEAGGPLFVTDLSRAELADYLNCERSALSREIGRMQTEGLIESHRGSFKLLRPDLLVAQYQSGG